MRRRKKLIIGAAIVAAATATTAIVVNRDQHVAPAAAAGAAATKATSSATVSKQDLTRTEELTGSVGHGVQSPLRLAGSGTITGLPAVDDVIEFGRAIAEVDGQPIVLLHGARPAWRPLTAGDKGEDVRQLQAALVEMGFADPVKVPADGTWTPATTAAVKVMQAWLHLPVDGRLDTTEIVFAPAPVRIAVVGGVLGDAAAAAGLQVTGLTQSVAASVKSSQLDVVHIGAAVKVKLPSGTTVDGVIDSIGKAAVGSDGTATFPVAVTTGAIDALDGTTLKVDVSVVLVANATVVPAEALLALAEGGFAVERPDAASATGTQLVPVTVGAFSGGLVQVTGALAVGDKVVIP